MFLCYRRTISSGRGRSETRPPPAKLKHLSGLTSSVSNKVGCPRIPVKQSAPVVELLPSKAPSNPGKQEVPMPINSKLPSLHPTLGRLPPSLLLGRRPYSLRTPRLVPSLHSLVPLSPTRQARLLMLERDGKILLTLHRTMSPSRHAVISTLGLDQLLRHHRRSVLVVPHAETRSPHQSSLVALILALSGRTPYHYLA